MLILRLDAAERGRDNMSVLIKYLCSRGMTVPRPDNSRDLR